MPSPADPALNPPKRPISVLSLDGGGIRLGGLSSLFLLRDLMTRLALKKGSGHTTEIRPAEHFDLIVGTGTGGISALFLGRMRMTVDEAIDEYIRVVETESFKPSNGFFRVLCNFFSSEAPLDGRRLEQRVGDIARRFLGDRDAPLQDELISCRTAVLACTGENVDAPPYVFRSYATSQPASSFAIYEVAHATISTAGLFTSVQLGTPPMRFVDAALLGYGNPTEIALNEAAQIWPGRTVDCLVSLGTGLQNIVHVGGTWGELIAASEKIAKDCQRAHNMVFERRRSDGNLPYFRFNVPRGLDTDFKGLSQARIAGKLREITEGYMRHSEVEVSLDLCIQLMNGEKLCVTKRASTRSLGKGVGKFLPLLNPAPEIFHGRNEYIEQAVTILEAKQAVRFAVLGPGGIGKTSIALTILHDPRITAKFGDDSRFVSCEGATSSASLVDTLCTAFEMQNTSADRQKALLAHLVHTYTTKPLFLILDNFETVWDVEQGQTDAESILKTLGQVPMLSLLVTMRGSEYPSGLRWTLPRLPIVQPLTLGAARQVFLEINEQEDEKLDELLHKVDFIPLAITLLAQLVSHTRPFQLVERWDREQTQLLSRPRDRGRLNNVEVSIRLSIESFRMQSTPDALILLSIVALLPGGVPEGDLGVICPRLGQWQLASSTLYEVGLAYYDSRRALHVLSPIRSYVMLYHPPSINYLHDLELYYFQLAALGQKCPGDNGYKDIVATLVQAESNMEAILIRALQGDRDNKRIVIQAALDWSYFLSWNSPRITIIQLAVRMAEKGNIKDMEALCLQSLGNIQHKLGNYDRAEKMLVSAQIQFEAVNDRTGAAKCLQSLGNIQRMFSNYDRAKEMLSTARAHFEAIDDKLETAQCLWSLGNIYRILGDYGVAQEILLTAQLQFEVIGATWGTARCLQTLGDIQELLGNHGRAQDILSTAQTQFEVTGDRLSAAQCLRSLGNIQSTLHNFDIAQQLLSTAQSRFEAVAGRLGVAQCLLGLGKIQCELGNYCTGEGLLSDAQSQFEDIGNKLGAMRCLQGLGNLQCMLKNYHKAQEILSTAQTQFEAIGSRLGVVQCLQHLGDIQYLLHNYDKAEEVLSGARAGFEALGDKVGSAECLQSLGDIQCGLGRYDKAREMLLAAQRQFKTIHHWPGVKTCQQSLDEMQQIVHGLAATGKFELSM